MAERDRERKLRESVRLREQVAVTSFEGQSLKREVIRRERLEMKLRASNKRLESANAELMSFGYAISHDLVAPLRRCGLLLSFLDEDQDPPLNDEARDHLTMAMKMTDQLGAMVEGVLECSRAGTNIQLREVAMNEVIAEALRNVSALLDVSGGTVEVADLPVLSGDRVRLLQLFQNLLQNAIRYRSDRPLHIEVSATEVLTAEKAKAWRIDVKDNGVGIKEGSLKEVFRLFSQLQRSTEGAGIGLSICKRVVEVHDGEINVVSEVGVGSTFQVTLPEQHADA